MTESPAGVLLINLGTPKSPTPRDLRRYLRQFLGDPFVDLGPPRLIWWLILHLVVLPFRPRKSAAMRKPGRMFLVHSGQGSVQITEDVQRGVRRTKLFPGTLAYASIPT